MLSVIIPTHHRPVELRRLLESLENQDYDYQNFEVLVVHSPNDSGKKVAVEFQEKNKIKLNYLEIPEDPHHGKSPAAKRNYAANKAIGEWLCFTDDDCVCSKSWLLNIAKAVKSSSFDAYEGSIIIPIMPDSKMTLTAKGMIRMQDPGGYQTCNMIYNKNVFMKLGGFNSEFSYYLEDTEMGWKFLQNNYSIGYLETAQVTHPIPPPDPLKMVTMAKKMKEHIFLKSNYPELYEKSRMEYYKRSYYPYLALYLFLLIGIGFMSCMAITSSLILLGTLSLIHVIKIFRGLAFTCKEICLTYLLLPLLPIISLFDLIKNLNVCSKTHNSQGIK